MTAGGAGRRDEIELLLLLSRVDLPPAGGERVDRLVAGQLDWDYVFGQAARHRVLPLLAHHLQARALYEATPELYSWSDPVRAALLFTRQRNLALAVEFAELMPAIRAEVPGVVLRKGMHLAHQVYPDAALRPMADLDLLVAAADTERVLDVLVRAGYRTGRPSADLRTMTELSRKERLFWRLHVQNLPPMTRLTSDPYARKFVVDVTTALFLPNAGYRIPTADILDRAALARVAGADVLVPAPEDVVLDLCAHIYKESTTLRYIHRGKHQRLIQYCDVRETLRRYAPAFDWELLVERCGRYGIAPVLYYALAHLEDLFPGTVPDGALKECAPPDPDGFLAEYGQVDLGAPRRWETGFRDRFFATAPPAGVPRSASPV